MRQRTVAGLCAFVLAAGPAASLIAADGVIKLGISSSASGSYSVDGSVRNGVEMAKQEINGGNGLLIGGRYYNLELVYVDNKGDQSTSRANVLDMISQQQVMAVIGPQNSDRGIIIGEVANAFRTPLVTPWSSAPQTTLNKPFVFRATVMYDIQATAITKFASSEWKAAKAAVLYDETSVDPDGMAKAFKQVFEKANGVGSVVAFESFRTGDTDFSKQLKAIINSGADFLYAPQYHRDVPLVVNQARKMGWKKPIAGNNTWSVVDLAEKCGDACKGLYFTGNFAAGAAEGKARAFVDNYQKMYKLMPDEVAALNYDAVYLIAEALKNINGLTGSVVDNRVKLRDQIASTKRFEGVTGTWGYFGTGDPQKCTVLIKVDDNGVLTNQQKVCPES